MRHTEAAELVALFAIDALPSDEAVEVEAHIASCPRCQVELAGFQVVTSSLTGDEIAPTGVWDRIADEIEQERATSGESEAPVDELAALRTRKTRSWQSLGLTAVAAAVIVVIAVNLRPADPLGESALIAAAEVAAEEDGSLVADFLVDDVAVAQVVLTADGIGYLIPTDQLAPIGSDRTYQLWVVTDEELVISAGVLGSDPRPAVFTWNGGVSGFALTREVAGGVVSSAGDVVSVVTDI